MAYRCGVAAETQQNWTAFGGLVLLGFFVFKRAGTTRLKNK
jgi:hypothetical protein